MICRIVTFGEVMLRLKTEGFKRFSQAKSFEADYGGTEANLAVSLSNYGFPVSFVTRLPNNALGRQVIRELKGHSIDTKHILQADDGRLGIYFLEKGSGIRAGRVLYDREHSTMAQIKGGMVNWDEVFEGKEWFHITGITPAISQGAADACLEAVSVAHQKGLTISLDLNYRSKLWNYGVPPIDIMPEIGKYCHVMLADSYSCLHYFGIEIPKHEKQHPLLKQKDFVNLSEKLMHKFPALQKIVASRRNIISTTCNEIAGVMYDGNCFYSSGIHKIDGIVDRVGAGDAFMASIIYGLNHYDDLRKTINFATIASCLKHSIEGDFNLSSVDEIEQIMGGSELRINR